MNERSVLTIGSFEGQGGFVWMTEVQKWKWQQEPIKDEGPQKH